MGAPANGCRKAVLALCLMAEPQLVADCAGDARWVAIPVTVKHRIGIDKIEEYDHLRNFVDVVASAGCQTFIVHARNAILKA